MMYDVRHLRYFVAVAAERSFTRGAERLNMAQPPLSRRIQAIEEELGTPLFDRDSRPLALTPAGKLFYEQAIQVIRRSEQMHATMKRFVAAERQRFAIGIVPSMLYARLPEVVRRFRARAPQVDLQLIDMNETEQVAALKEGRIDVAFGRLRQGDPAVRREILREEPLVVALASDHPFALEKGPVDLATIATLPLIVYPREPRPSYADFVIAIFQDRGLYPSQIVEVSEHQTALVMAAAGEGACILPESLQQMGRVDIGFRELDGATRVPVILSYRAEDRSEGLQLLFRSVREVYVEWGYSHPRDEMWPLPETG